MFHIVFSLAFLFLSLVFFYLIILRMRLFGIEIGSLFSLYRLQNIRVSRKNIVTWLILSLANFFLLLIQKN